MKDALNEMENNKAPGNDNLTKRFFKTCWPEIKSSLLLTSKKGFVIEEVFLKNKLFLRSLKRKMKIKG